MFAGGYAEAVEKNKERILEQISSSQLLLASSKQFLSSDSKVQFDSLKPDAQIGGKSSVSVFSLRVMTCVTTSEAAHMPALQLTSSEKKHLFILSISRLLTDSCQKCKRTLRIPSALMFFCVCQRQSKVTRRKRRSRRKRRCCYSNTNLLWFRF